MAEEKLLTVRDVSVLLNVSEKDVIDLAEDGSIPAYKVGGLYLRFKKEQIEEYRKLVKKTHPNNAEEVKAYAFKDKIGDFFYFNDFYVLSFIVIIAMLFIIFRG